jgi:tRNA/rRNA methyltransferase
MEPFGASFDPFIILHKTQLAENTGMVMRAMVNAGVKKLRLAAPLHGWPSRKAELASAEKSNFLKIEVFDSLEDAISDLHFTFAASARRRNLIKEIYSPENIPVDKISGKTGFVFGSEKNGLSNDEISMCNGVVNIPSADFSSYNLSQAALIICYQLMRRKTESPLLKIGKTRPSTQGEMEIFLKKLERELSLRNHFPSERKQILMMQTIRNLFKRSRPTAQEIRSMMGVVETLIQTAETL